MNSHERMLQYEKIDRISISFSLGEETALVDVSISKGGLKCQRVMLSDMPNWGGKVICSYTGCTGVYPY